MEWLVVGKLVAVQGLEGELRVLPLSDFPQRFTRPGVRWVQSLQQPPAQVTLLGGRQLPGRDLFVVRLAGIHSRSEAEALVGAQLLVPASDRPPLEPGEFHLLDLVGLPVHVIAPGTSGPPSPAPLGTVSDLIHGGNDLLEVELSDPTPTGGTAKRRVLIPFVEAIVPVVNLREGWIGLTPPPGLLDL